MAETIIDLKGNVIVADEFRGTVTPPETEVTAADVTVEGYPAGGVTAGDLQAVLEGLADRIQALEDATP